MANGFGNTFLDYFAKGADYSIRRQEMKREQARQKALGALSGLVPSADLAQPSDAGLQAFLAETAPPEVSFEDDFSGAGDATRLPGAFNLMTGEFNPIDVATPGFNPNEPHPLAAVGRATRSPAGAAPTPTTAVDAGPGASRLFETRFPDAQALPGTDYSFVPSLTAEGRRDAAARAAAEAERERFLSGLDALDVGEGARERAAFAAQFDVDKALTQVLDDMEAGRSEEANVKAHETLTTDPLTAPFYKGIPYDPGENYVDALLEARGDLARENRIRTRPVRTGGGGGTTAGQGAGPSVVGKGRPFGTISEMDRAADAAAASIPEENVQRSLETLKRVPANVRTAYQNRMILALERRLKTGNADDPLDEDIRAFLEAQGQASQ